MNELLMGIDVGTTSTKAVVTDLSGETLCITTAEYPLLFPKIGWAEQKPQDLLDGVLSAMKEAAEKLGDKAKDVCALSFSTQRDTVIPLDENDQPLWNAITWMDTRATKECEKLKTDMGEDRFYASTGVPVSTIWTGAFILWLRENAPEVFDKSAMFSLVHDYLLCALGAKEHVLDTTNACETMMYDFVRGVWDKEILDYMGISEEKLPKLVEPGTVVGALSAEIAERTGLPEGLLLVSGGGDQQCAMLGSGAIALGDGEVGIGTAANIMAATKTPLFDEQKKLICHRSLVPNGFLMEGAMLSTGKLIEWLRDLFYSGVKNPFKVMDAEVERDSKPGAGGMFLTPHFEGSASPHWDEDARGICVGLTLGTKRADVCRAVMEGVALEIKKNLILMEKMGVKLKRMVVTGGAGNSPVWLQIIADVLNLPVVTLQNKQCAAMGGVILAGVGSGRLATFEEGVNTMVRVKETYLPRAEYRELYDSLLDLDNRSFAALQGAGVYRDQLALKQKLQD